MEDESWDLHAVVRSCNTTTSAHVPSTAAHGTNTATATTINGGGDYFDVMRTVESCRDDVINPVFSYLNSTENLSEGLEEVYKEGCSQRFAMMTTKSSTMAVVSVGDEYVHEMENASESLSIETPSRKRKNKQKKMVVELSQDELYNDTWAWRKYGQKPIKGSPFPRNYYKCSTLKACGARKQVEQSHSDPTVFIVSYSGEHIHPRPTHRSPLAGSTRSTKFVTSNAPTIS